MLYNCGNCRSYLQQSEFAGICTNPDCKYFGDHVGISESCNRWCQNDEKHKLRPPTKAESLCNRCFHNNACSSALKELLLVKELLCGQYPVCKDFVEIIRCKECEHCTVEKTSIPGDDQFREFSICICEHPKSEVGSEPIYMEPDDFCSYGERRKDG